MYQLKQLPWQFSSTRHSTVYAALWTEKLNLLNKQCFYRNSTVSKVTTSVQGVVFRPWHTPTIVLPSFIALPIIRCSCSKLAQKFAVQVCQVATVVVEITQLRLRQFNNFYRSQLRIEQRLSMPKIISKCCELVKLCHINRRGPDFLTHRVLLAKEIYYTLSSAVLRGRSILLIFTQLFKRFSFYVDVLTQRMHDMDVKSIDHTSSVTRFDRIK